MPSAGFEYFILGLPVALVVNTPNGDTNSETHPLPYTEFDLCRIAFRVKTWRVVAQGLVSAPGSSTRCNWNFVMSGLIPRANEIDFQQGPDRFSVINRIHDSIVGPGNGFLSIGVFDDTFMPNNIRVFAGTNNYFPRVRINMDISGGASGSAGVHIDLDSPAPPANQSATIRFDGRNIAGKTFNTTIPAGGSFVASLEIIQESFWPYDPGDGGGPIYNTVTGTNLRSSYPPI